MDDDHRYRTEEAPPSLTLPDYPWNRLIFIWGLDCRLVNTPIIMIALVKKGFNAGICRSIR